MLPKIFKNACNLKKRLREAQESGAWGIDELYKIFCEYDEETVKLYRLMELRDYDLERNNMAGFLGNYRKIVDKLLRESIKDDETPKTEETNKMAQNLDDLNESVEKAICKFWPGEKGEYMEEFDKKNYKLEMVVPGYNEDDLQITITPAEGKLTITSKEQEDKKWYQPKISITEDLPETVDYTSFTKTLKNGILTIEAKMVEKPEEESFEL